MITIRKSLMLLLISVSLLSFAQEKKQIAISKDLVGFWRRVDVLKDYNGNKRVIPTPDYKVIDANGTYYGFTAKGGDGSVPQIVQYGDYEIKSDSAFVEKITHHSNPKNKGTTSNMKFKIANDDYLMISYKNESVEDGKEIKETWIRVKLIGDKNKKPIDGIPF